MKYNWKLVGMEVKKDVTIRTYEDEETRHTKTVWEWWKYTQYHSYKASERYQIKDADGMVVEQNI